MGPLAGVLATAVAAVLAGARSAAAVAEWANDATSTARPNELTRFQPLLAHLDLTAVLVTADASHTQREHARWLTETKQAGYVFTVKRNQPRLYRQLKTVPWAKIPV